MESPNNSNQRLGTDAGNPFSDSGSSPPPLMIPGQSPRRRRRRSRNKDKRHQFVAREPRKASPFVSQLDVPDDERREDAKDPHRLAAQVLRTWARHGEHWTWRHWKGLIYEWERGRYRPLHDDELRAVVTGALKQHFNERVSQGEDRKAYPVSTHLMTSVINAIKSLMLVNSDAIPLWLDDRENAAEVFAFRNGLVEIDRALGGDIVLTDPDPRWFSRVCFPFHLDVHAECPRWLAFVEEILPDEADRLLVQEIFGYCLVPDTRYHHFFVLVGNGSNGKSVTLTMLTELLGDENVSSVPLEDFADTFALETTVGKLANIVNEVESTKKFPESTIKKYTSGERITVKRKHLRDIQVMPTARLLVSTNEMPEFKDQSEGIARRFVPLCFSVHIPAERRDPALVSKLVPELPGIFLWALEGLRRLRQRGSFDLPENSRALIEESRPARLSADEFLAEMCEGAVDGWVATQDLYQRYRDWCSERARRVESNAMFCTRIALVHQGARKQRQGSGDPRPYGYAGIRFKQEPGMGT